jgi:hypothetical protein
MMLLGIGCLIVGALLGLGAWAFDLLNETDEAELARRRDYQWKLRWCIGLLCRDGLDDDTEEELQWTLHSLLYEYRCG